MLLGCSYFHVTLNLVPGPEAKKYVRVFRVFVCHAHFCGSDVIWSYPNKYRNLMCNVWKQDIFFWFLFFLFLFLVPFLFLSAIAILLVLLLQLFRSICIMIIIIKKIQSHCSHYEINRSIQSADSVRTCKSSCIRNYIMHLSFYYYHIYHFITNKSTS